MRTTLIIDDWLLTEAKRRAVDRGVTLSDLVSEALRAALAEPTRSPAPFEMVTYGHDVEPACHEPTDFAAALDADDDASLR